MPTDFVAKWIAFLGKVAFSGFRLKEPFDPEERAFYQLMLGIISLMFILISIASVVVFDPGILKSFVGLMSNPGSEPWLGSAFGASLLVLLLSVTMPQIVGGLFRLKQISSAVGWVIVGIPAAVFLASWYLDAKWTGIPAFFTAALMAVKMCPDLPADQEQAEGKGREAG